MALSEKLWSPPTPATPWQEIQRDEFHKYSSRLREELETVCMSSAFRTSSKSCEFLRHIVIHTLAGNVDVLKERLIGMALLGRDASYDTSTDAGVRVRANDVRKRLTVHNEGHASDSGFYFTLPAGAYVPLFFRSDVELQHASEFELPAPPPERSQPEPAVPLSLYRLTVPTLAALFLCIICMRWQFTQEHSFTSFWQQVLQDDRAVLYLPPSGADAGQELVAIQGLKVAAPLLDLAGEFHHRFTLMSTPAPSTTSGGMLVYINVVSGHAGGPDAASALPDPSFPARHRFVIENTPAGRVIFDRNAPNPHQPLSGRAALFTVIDGTRPMIYIDGTDDAAIRMLVERLCDQSTFPGGLADSFRQGTLTQAVFPVAPHVEETIVHEPLPRLQADLERWP